MKVAIYSRKSKSTGKGESIQNQIDLCKEHIENFFPVNEFIVYEDEGFSGGNADRPQYKKMLSDAKSGRFSILICYRLDRISRNISDFSKTIEILNSLDISFISLREQFDTSTPMGRAMMYIASVFAQLERETIAERIKDNMLSLAQTGRWLGGNAPTGYKSIPIHYYDDKSNKKTMYKLSQIPGEIDAVKQIFSKYLSLGSLSQVELWAMKSDLRTKNNNLFDITGIRSILTNMVYIKSDMQIFNYCKSLDMNIASDISEFDGKSGLMVYNKNIIKKGKSNKLRPTSEWIVSVGKHKGVISSDDFILVQQNLRKNSKNAPKTIRNNRYLLGPVIKCDLCKSSFRTTYGRIRKDGSRPHYYKCILKEKSRGNKCNISNLNGSHADSLIIEILKDSNISFNYLFNILKEQKREISFLEFLYNNGTTELENSISKYKGMISKLVSSLSVTTDSNSSKYIIRQIEDLDLKVIECENKLKNKKNESTDSNHLKRIEKMQSLIFDFPSTVEHLTISEKRVLIHSVIKSATWDNRSLKIFI